MYAAPVDEREGLEIFGSWMGLRNNVSPDGFGRGDLSVCVNCDIDDALGISRRKGHSAVLTANVDRDLWASGSVCLGVGSNALKQVLPDYSTITLRSGLTASRPLSYAAVGDRVYYSNGVEAGCVRDAANHSWGLDIPAVPVATTTGGTLPAGEYQYAVTYLREDGQESGTGRAGTITLAATGGIALSAISVSADIDVAHKVVYMSSTGGETLYRVGVILNSETVFAIRELRMNASPLLTQFLQPPPPGDHIAYWNGYMLVGDKNRLYPSGPYSPELFDLRKSVPFLDAITMIAPVKDGVWLGLDGQIIWLTGSTPETWDYRAAANYGVIPGTAFFADTGVIGDGQSTGEMAAFFASKRGLCVGLPGGRLTNLTEARFSYPIQERGAGVVRQHRGINQFLVTLRGAETAGNVAT